MLAVEDPNEPTNDLGKGSYNIQKVGAQVCACSDKGRSAGYSLAGSGRRCGALLTLLTSSLLRLSVRENPC